jgi:tetratricopeptide (TPR) repeat protein/tRNA A-37 threonylcarbamoyl transferase component Bud32
VRISHYELLQPIGRDGTSEIYRARDLRLEREVAVKLLRPEELKRPEALEQFRREARIASLVTHPHICAVHDSGEEAGQPFLVCELLDGRALDEVLSGGPLPPDRALEFAAQLTEALSAAHRRQIVHGNLKPSNVFITTDGHVKLLELGSASTASGERNTDGALDSSSPTATSDAPRRPAPAADAIHPYVSPEQLAGPRIDERSDIFAVGALLYEMVTGARAFPGDTAAKIAAAVAAQEPARVRADSRRISRVIDEVTRKALQKDPARRHQTAGELLEDLRRARRAIELPPAGSAWPFRRPVAALAIVAAAVVVGGVAATGLLPGWWRPGAPAVERSRVLVSHIANGTADPDFDGTLREAVTVYLAQSPYLELVSDDRIRSALQLMDRDPAIRMTHDVAAEVCQRLGLQAMLEGSVSAVGRAIVVALVATDCSNGATIARHQVEVERKEDVLRAIGPLSESLRTALGESRASLARHNVPIEEATTPSLDALKAYTEAAARRAAGAELEAIPFLERAIALDPRFALAHTTLSTLYGGLGETGRSEEFARRAYENRHHVSERERLFITYQYHDRVTGDQIKARETLDVWKHTYPRDYRPPNALAVLLNRLGDYDAAAAEAEEAIRRNPAHAFPPSNLAYAHRGAGRYAQARSIAEDTVSRGIETVPTRRLLYQLGELQGDRAAAQAQLEWAARNLRGFDIVGARAQVEAYRGHMAAARALYRETIASAEQQGLSQVASGYAAQAALTEAVYGYAREALEQGRHVIRSSTAFEPQLRAAAALALAGAPDEADAVVRRLRGVRPDDTLLHAAYLPVAEAAVLMQRGAMAQALEQLRPAARFERGMVAALAPAYLRGEARLRAGAAADAADAFRVVLDHRGAEPFSPLLPVARVGLARALSQLGDVAGSRAAYEALLSEWADADADLPVRLEASREMERVR